MENPPDLPAASAPSSSPTPLPTNGLTGAIRTFLKPFALSLKLGSILVLVLLLQIPLFMIRGLLDERCSRREAAVREITETWGRTQNIVGPILVVPYRTLRVLEKETAVNGHSVRTTEERMGTAYACFLPEELTVEGNIDPSKRHRGIYEAVVYTSHLKLSGRFAAPDLKPLGIAPDALQWNRAWISFGISDLRGTRETLKLAWDGQTLPLTPGTQIEGLRAGLHADLSATANIVAPNGPHTFSMELSLNGSGTLAFAPLAVQTSVRLKSPWADPSFTGAFLPTEREITPAGFNALWKVPYYGREYSQQWTCLANQAALDTDKIDPSCFGVDLVTPVDSYRSVERATKHGALFITLLFTAFFLFEVLASLRLHALHYLLVGAALCLFYLGLLSLSEFSAFGTAYLIAAASSTLLIGLYCRSILRSGTRSFLITAALSAIYGFLYFVLQMQDYSLLAGTAALFTVLAVVMYTTRKVDWSNQSRTT
ncbi:MAG: cell envelope integrity protein CreD [Verrucomicrobia bacterium]|nr:cell envelope integrity protein CreD [Verrucomicrobiota bacterium]